MSELVQDNSKILDNKNEDFSNFIGLSYVTFNKTVFLFATVEDSSDLMIKSTNTNIINKLWSLSINDVYNDTQSNPIPLKVNQKQNNEQEHQPSIYFSPAIVNEKLDEIILFAPTIKSNFKDNLTITNDTKSTIANNTRNGALSIFKFDIINGKNWIEITSRDIENQTNIIPLDRQDYTISVTPLNKEHVYLFGGINSTLPLNDFWTYSLKYFQWTKLDLPTTINTRCGHTSTILSDGRMVLIGGYDCYNNFHSEKTIQKDKQVSLNLIQMDNISVFHTIQSVWLESPKVSGFVPSPRIYHSSVLLNKKDDIFVCGGQNGIIPPFQIYLGSEKDKYDEMTAILDTTLWTWRAPKPSYLYQPYPQSKAVITFLNETKLIYGYGSNYYSTFNKFHMFDIANERWESPVVNDGVEKTFLDTIFNKNDYGNYSLAISNTTTILFIVLGCISFIIIIAYATGLWLLGYQKLHFKISNLLKALKKEIWRPRVGEPSWAEAARLSLKVLFFLIFIYFIFILSSQVINSPVINQLSYESDANVTINAPDIRICFNDWVEDENPIISCTTNFGVQCSQFAQLLELEKPKQSNKVCYMFRAPSSFKLGRTSKRLESSGSHLKFDYYYNSTKNHSLIDKESRNYQTQVNLYSSLQGNNHTDESSSIISKLLLKVEKVTNSAFDAYKMYGVTENAYQLNTKFVSTISYESIKRVTLNNVIWNYIGVVTFVNINHEIETKIASESDITEYNPLSGSPQPFGSLHIIPLNYEVKVIREQKAFAFINAIGIFGGLFGLLYSLQTCLFGYRPRSPWGYMHRWSFGHFRSSLMNGLQNNFFPGTSYMTNNSIPMVSKDINRVYPNKIKNEYLSTIKEQTTEDDIIVNATRSIVQNEVISTSIIEPKKQNPTKLSPLVIPKKENNEKYLLSPSPVIDFSSIMDSTYRNEIRMSLIEERIYILEKLFQAYYIDDEIFRSLGQALETVQSKSSSSSISSNLSDDSIFARRKTPRT